MRNVFDKFQLLYIARICQENNLYIVIAVSHYKLQQHISNKLHHMPSVPRHAVYLFFGKGRKNGHILQYDGLFHQVIHLHFQVILFYIKAALRIADFCLQGKLSAANAKTEEVVIGFFVLP